MADALTVLGIGFVLGVSLAAPPGPILALAAHRTVRRGYWPGASVVLGATVGDCTWALVMGFGLIRIVRAIDGALPVLSITGGLLMLYFAWMAFRSARHPPDLVDDATGEGRVGGHALIKGGAAGYVLAITSPYNFAWWLGAGTALFNDYGAVVFFGFVAGIVAFSLTFVGVVRWAAERVQGVVAIVSYVSAALLTAFALVLIVRGWTTLAL